MAILGLLAVTASVAAGVWFMKGRPADPAPATESESPEASEDVLAEPATAEASVESTQPDMAETPVSTEESAEAWPPAEESAQEASFTPPSSTETLSPETPSAELAESPGPSAEATAGADDRSSEAAEGASDFDALRAKNELWRERYRPAKARVDRLQAEVAKLEEDAKNNFVAGQRTEWIRDRLVVRTPDPNSPHRSYAERIQERLPAARRELADAKEALAAVEEAARRDGVASGQLY